MSAEHAAAIMVAGAMTGLAIVAMAVCAICWASDWVRIRGLSAKGAPRGDRPGGIN
jgi:hypothetical protein